MRNVSNINLAGKVFITRFYTQNAGFFLFIFVMMFGIVQGGLLLRYHYQLIMGILQVPAAFAVALGLWTLYLFKCMKFVNKTIVASDGFFLRVLNELDNQKKFVLFLYIQFALYLPVILYGGAVTAIAVNHHYLFKAITIVIFELAVCVYPAARYSAQMKWPGIGSSSGISAGRVSIPRSYLSFLLLQLVNGMRMLVAGVKLFSCLLLFLFLRTLGEGPYDLRMLMMLYTMSLLGHSIIVHKLREFEETRLVFYRQLPVNVWKRWVDYCLFYIILILPEMIMIAQFIPAPLHLADGVNIIFFTLSLLLFLHSMLSASSISSAEFLNGSFAIFVAVYFFVLAGAIVPMYILFFVASSVIFITRYNYFERLTG